jgi:tetratricopeptide (TPR) repeat protein
MVIGTYRPSDLHSGSPLSDTLASLRREASAVRIDLAGLDDLEVIEMMEGFAGHEMDQVGVDLAHAVRRETEGNAFFTTELLRHLGESGLIYQNETGRWVASEDLYEKGLPQSVREVVGQRVDRLGDEMRRVLSQAAVIGREFDIEVLAGVADVDEDALLDVIDAAVRAGIVVELEGSVERFTFAHGLTQHTLHDDMGATRRARAHHKIAEVLEDLYGAAPETHAAELARHFVAATKSVDGMKALTYSKLAGDQALAQFAPADALGWFSQALDLYSHVPPDGSIHCDLLIGLGMAQRRTGDPAHRQTLLDAAAIAQSNGDGERLVAAALANYSGRGGASSAGHVDDDRVAMLEAGLVAVGPADNSERARLLATLGAELLYADLARSTTLSADALAMAQRLNDPRCYLYVIGVVHTDWSPRTVDERLSDLSRAVTLAETLGDPLFTMYAHRMRSIACLQAADRAGYDADVDALTALTERMGDHSDRWGALLMEESRALLAGDLDRSRGAAEAAWAIGAESVPEAMGVYATQLIDIQRIEGRWDDLADAAELMAAHLSETPGLPIVRATLARVYCDLNRDDEARGVIEDDFADGFVRFPDDVHWFSSMIMLSEVCVHLALVDGAEYLYACLSPWPGLFSTSGGVSTSGPVALHLGALAALLGRFDDAHGHFTESLDVSERMQSPYWIARTQIGRARLLRESDGSGQQADGLLTSAMDTARQYGFGALVEQIDELQGCP